MAHPVTGFPDDRGGDAVAAAVVPVSIARVAGDTSDVLEDAVACEEPLEIRLGGVSLAVVMRTPGHDEELALGFLVTERVVTSIRDVASVRHCSLLPDPEADGNVVRVVLRPGVRVDTDALRRNFYVSSSCGICGKASIESALAVAPPVIDESSFEVDLLFRWIAALEASQHAFSRTGGLHAAGLFSLRGRLVAAREDVGRHNAVDKVIGWALAAGRVPLAGHGLLVSGRCSFEIVQKAVAAGIPLIAAVSAPTSLAVRFAEEAGITLVGFLRGRGLNVYCGHHRIAGSGVA